MKFKDYLEENTQDTYSVSLNLIKKYFDIKEVKSGRGRNMVFNILGRARSPMKFYNIMREKVNSIGWDYSVNNEKSELTIFKV